MATIKELITRFGFEVDDQPIKDLDAGIDTLKGGLMGLGAVSIGAAASIFALVKTSANATDTIHDTAISLGVSTKELQEWGYAAQLSGSSMEQFAGSLQFLNRNIADAAKNRTGDTAVAFRKLGISVKDSHGNLRSAIAISRDVSSKMAAMKNPTEKAALAMQFYGRSGGQLVQMLEKGPAKIEAMSKELQAFGGIMSDNQLNTLGDFNDSLDRIWAVIKGIGMSIAAQLAPQLTAIVDGAREFMVANADLIKQNITGFVNALSSFLYNVWRAIKFVAAGFAILIKMLGGAETATRLFLAAFSFIFATGTVAGIMMTVKAVWALVTALGVANATALLIPAAIVAAFAIVFLIIEDIVAFVNGEDSLFGEMMKQIEKFMTWISGKIEAWVQGFAKWFASLLEPITRFFESVGNKMSAFVNGDGMIKSLSNWAKGLGGSNVNGNSQQTVTGLTPGNSPVNNANNQNVQVTAPITVTVPEGTAPGMVGDRVQAGIGDGLGNVLRSTQRASSPGVSY